MRKIIPLFVLSVLFGVNAFALDPVAPKADRAFGFIKIESPLPSDTCKLTGKNESTQVCKVGEMMKIPIGSYSLAVRLQGDKEWASQVEIKPTEYTKVTVTGYGNLKVNTPHPQEDKVEVFTEDGRLIKSFHSSNPQTLPTGTYSLKIKVGKASTTQSNVVIVTNTTRELDVSGGD